MHIVAASALLVVVLLASPLAEAQNPHNPQNPMMAAIKAQHDQVKGYLLKTAEILADDLYSFRPTPDVRSVAQLIGHIADASAGICGSASGDKPPALNAEKSMSTKAQLTKALAEAMAFCDKVIAGMDDKRALETTKFFVGGTSPRGMVLAFNTAHSFEHYGNLVTYMRLNKIVPPSSAGK
jgi:uncharacterized damage-inducible protein DinB